MNSNEKRVIYLDILRVFAIIAVIMLHTSAQNWNTTVPSSLEWNVFNVFESCSRWGVPIFVMISGAIFLDNSRTITIKKIFFNNIKRLIIVYLVWDFIYATLYCQKSLDNWIERFVDGHFHLWYLPTLIGLYIITPVLRKIVEDKKITEYFLVLAILFNFVIPYFLKLSIFQPLNTLYSNINFRLTLGFSFYYMCGYYLHIGDISKKFRYLIYIFGIIGFIMTIAGSAYLSIKSGTPNSVLYHNFSPTIMAESLFVFTVVKTYTHKINDKVKSGLFKISKYCFGIYLIHALILEILRYNGFTTLVMNPILAVPCIGVIVFLISLLISIVINHIPILKKYIV